MKKYLLVILLIIMPISGVLYSQLRINMPIDSKTMNLSTKIAYTHLGLSETNNRGWHIRLYGIAVFGKPIDGFYYCYAFQYWSVDSACKQLNVANPMPKTGHCLTAFNIAKKKYSVENLTLLKVNDIIIWANKSGNGHAGRIVEILDSKKWIAKTLEGNTSSDNSNVRNGGMITTKKRYLKFPISRMLLKGVLNGK